MLETHTTSDGHKMLVAEMRDSHLMNTIRLYCRKMQDTRNSIDAKGQMSPVERAMYDLPEHTPEEAGWELKRLANHLYPYLAEAFLRGLDTPGELIDAVGRNSRLVFNQVAMIEGETVLEGDPGYIGGLIDVD